MEEEKQIIEDLKDWKNIIKPYTIAENKTAYREIVKTIVPFIVILLACVFVYDYSVWACLLLSIINGLFLTRVFIIQHDCGHQSYFSDKKKNDQWGFICSFITCIPYKYWARSHHHHHAHQGQLDTRTIGDVTLLTLSEYQALSRWKKIQYRIYRSVPVIFVLGPIYYIFIHNRLPFIDLKGWEKEKKLLVRTNFYLLLFYSSLFLLLSLPGFDWLYAIKKLAFIYVPILLVFAFTAVWFFYMQHQHDPNYKAWKEDWQFVLAAIRGSSFYQLPAIVNFFTGNIGYHHIHHLAPKVPFYNLKKSSEENPIFQKHVTKITLLSSIKYAFYTLWDEENYRMIRFSQVPKNS